MNLGCLKPLKVCGNLLAARENPRAIKHNAVAVTPLYCPLLFPLLSCISQINTFYWSLFAISNPMFLNVRKKGFYSEIPFSFASLFLPCLELCISRYHFQVTEITVSLYTRFCFVFWLKSLVGRRFVACLMSVCLAWWCHICITGTWEINISYKILLLSMSKDQKNLSCLHIMTTQVTFFSLP